MSTLSTSSSKIPLVENLLVFLLAGLMAALTPINRLVKLYLWDPPGGLYTIMCLVLVETIATAFLNPHVDYRALLIRLGKFVAGYTFTFFIVHWLNKFDPSTDWMRPLVMNGSAALHFYFLLRAMARLGFMRPEVAVTIAKRTTEHEQLDPEESAEVAQLPAPKSNDPQ